MMKQTVICLGRQAASGGHEVGKRLAKKQGWAFYDQSLLEMAARRGNVNLEKLEAADERRSNPWLFEAIHEGNENVGKGASPSDALFQLHTVLIPELALEGGCVFVGRCANYILRQAGIPHLAIFINAPFEERLKRKMKLEGMEERETAALLHRMDRDRKGYYEYYTGTAWGQPENYDFCINSFKYGMDGTADLIAALAGWDGDRTPFVD